MSFYAVAIGRDGPKIYSTWNECKAVVNGYSGVIYKKFNTEKAATDFIAANSKPGRTMIEKKETIKHHTKVKM
jgi:viroplasmin and RNaseH domain-containing protein